MRSRGLRLTFGVGSLIAIAAVAAFFLISERHLSSRRAAVHAFDQRAREAAAAFDDVKAAQLAYVTAGQGAALWTPKVDNALNALATLVPVLRQSATTVVTLSAVDEIESGLAEFGRVDKRVRGFLESSAPLMAADVILTEGISAATNAGHAVERAGIEERRALDEFEVRRRREEALALSGAAGIALLTIVLLLASPRPREERIARTAADSGNNRAEAQPAAVEERPLSTSTPRGAGVLAPVAQLCTEFGRISDFEELNALLGRAADILDASGLVLWMRNPTGAELGPALSHGYNQETVARFPQIPRSADNAAAIAYRTETLQVVLSRPGLSKGAVAAPLLSADGCLGVLSAEIRDGGEASDSVQALATILAAQLSSLLVPASAPDSQRAAGSGALY